MRQYKDQLLDKLVVRGEQELARIEQIQKPAG
jgi:hypothetical protein